MPTSISCFRYWLWTTAPRWSTLRRLGTSRLIRTSYFWLLFVPIIAKALAKINTEISVPFWDNVLRFQIELPFSWKCFYLSAVAFSWATLTFSLKCPPLIRDYAKHPDFSAEGKGNVDLGSEMADYACHICVLAVIFPPVQDLWTVFLQNYMRVSDVTTVNAVELQRGMRSGIQSGGAADGFYAARRVLDYARPNWRLNCAFAYGIGGVLFLWVLIENFMFVVRAMQLC